MPTHNAYPDTVRIPLIQAAKELMNGPQKLSAGKAAQAVAPGPGLGPSAAAIESWLKPKHPPKGKGQSPRADSRDEALALLKNLLGEGLTFKEAARTIASLPGAPSAATLHQWAVDAGMRVHPPAKQEVAVVEAEVVTAEIDWAGREIAELRAALEDKDKALEAANAALDAANHVIDMFCPPLAAYVNYRSNPMPLSA